MTEMGKFLIFAGGILVVVGAALVILGRVGIPLGKLPGDIVYRGKNSTVYFPLATSVVLSVLLTLVLWVLGKSRK
jgi:hypothetical protein